MFINKIKFLKLLMEFIIGIEIAFFKVIVLNQAYNDKNTFNA